MKYLVSPEHLPIFPVGPKGSFAYVFHGNEHGLSSVSLMMSELHPGDGPPWHRHAYDEVFVVQAGTGRFLIGETTVDAVEGEVVLIPAAIPHTFANTGDTILRLTAVHVAPQVVIDWVESPPSEDPETDERR